MKRTLSAVCCVVAAFAISIAGCGDSKPKNISEGLELSDIEKYEAGLKDDAAAMTKEDAEG